jgi:hypothetical protein
MAFGWQQIHTKGVFWYIEKTILKERGFDLNKQITL